MGLGPKLVEMLNQTLNMSSSGLQTGHNNQCVKLKYLCTALITAWMGAHLALSEHVDGQSSGNFGFMNILISN